MARNDWRSRAREVAGLDPKTPFHKKVAVAGLDPAGELRHGYWAGIDFRNSELAGFDFAGADISGCSFDGANIAGAHFDKAILARDGGGPPADLTAAADYATFVASYRPSPKAPKDLSHLPLGAVYFVAPGITLTRGKEPPGAGSGSELRLLPQARHKVRVVVAVTPDGRQIVSGSYDKTVRVWDAGSGRLLRTLQGHSDVVTAIVIKPDGQIVSGSRDNTVKVWDAGSGRLLRTLQGHRDMVTALAIEPNGQIVSGSNDGTVRVWDVGSGRLLRTLEGHADMVTAVAVTPDGRQIVSGSYDKTVRVWDAGSGHLLHRLQGHTSGITAVAIIPDITAVVSQDFGRTTYCWDLATKTRSKASTDHHALLDATRQRHPGLKIIDGDLYLAAPDGSPRARLITLPAGHWVALLFDGSTYAGSNGCEEHMQLSDGSVERPLDQTFVAARRRDKLEINWP